MRYFIEIMTPAELRQVSEQYMEALKNLRKKIEEGNEFNKELLQEIYDNIKEDLDYVLAFYNINKRLGTELERAV